MDLRHVDLHISEQKLTIKSAFFKSYFAFSFDLKAGYHHFDIFPNCHKYLAFSWDFWHRVCQTFSIYGSAFCAF